MIFLTLPFPPSELNPNKRLHWAQKMKIKNIHKQHGFMAGCKHKGIYKKQNIPITMIFFPATKHHFDLDNALASSKAMLDGLAQGLGINDKQFRPITLDLGIPDKMNPRTEVTLS